MSEKEDLPKAVKSQSQIVAVNGMEIEEFGPDWSLRQSYEVVGNLNSATNRTATRHDPTAQM
jgi:hypothetical protein